MKRKYVIILLLFIAVFISLGYKTYSYYVTRFNVSVSSESANIICDAEIQPLAEKNMYGYSEFKVVVKNYNDSLNLTKEPFKYIITVENNNSSNGIFGYNNEFPNNLSIDGTLLNNSRNQNEHIIQVKSSNGLSENINYKVKVKCVQSA